MAYGTPRKEQCGICGSNAQKICWACFHDTIEDLTGTIDEMDKEIMRLNRVVEILLARNGGLSEAEQIKAEA